MTYEERRDDLLPKIDAHFFCFILFNSFSRELRRKLAGRSAVYINTRAHFSSPKPHNRAEDALSREPCSLICLRRRSLAQCTDDVSKRPQERAETKTDGAAVETEMKFPC